MKNNYIESCMPYQGNKYNLLPQIIPLFPKKIGTFVDLFCGSGVVGINVDAEYIIMNDKCKQIINILREIYSNGEGCYKIIKGIIETFELSKTNADGYYDLRRIYNKQPYVLELYVLICHSFSNQVRFNRKGEFNLPFGKRTFNENLDRRFKEFIDKVSGRKITFASEDFRNLEFEGFDKEELFVYVDPPYAISTATYNESGGWTEQDETDLLEYLDNLNKQGVKWALSNVTHHKDLTNDLLIEFSKCYNVHELKYNYKNCNYQVKNKNSVTREILITNY